VTAENTSCLNRAADLGEQQAQLEERLGATQHSVLADAVSMKRKEAEERDRMVQVRVTCVLEHDRNHVVIVRVSCDFNGTNSEGTSERHDSGEG
jgi:hypothetical protein